MSDRPILFNGPMVRAIINGRKTMTRRMQGLDAVNEEPGLWKLAHYDAPAASAFFAPANPRSLLGPIVATCPFGVPGDRLWGKETWWDFTRPMTGRLLREGADTWPEHVYDADLDDTDRDFWREHGWKRRPSIHMSKWAARIWLEIKAVRVERLQDISRHDAIAEGCPPDLDAGGGAGQSL